jgi:hypothetical protein
MPMKFKAIIEIAGINPYVAVPAEVSRVMAKQGHIPVKGIHGIDEFWK